MSINSETPYQSGYEILHQGKQRIPQRYEQYAAVISQWSSSMKIFLQSSLGTGATAFITNQSIPRRNGKGANYPIVWVSVIYNKVQNTGRAEQSTLEKPTSKDRACSFPILLAEARANWNISQVTLSKKLLVIGLSQKHETG